jgi:hypothetical protein
MAMKNRLAALEAAVRERAIRHEAERIAKDYGLSADEVLEEAEHLFLLEPAELERQLAALEATDEAPSQTA